MPVLYLASIPNAFSMYCYLLMDYAIDSNGLCYR